jgi:hypothetical protein
MVRRFVAASEGYFGRVMHIVKEAASYAIDDGAEAIGTARHLGQVYTHVYGAKRPNPFLLPEIHQMAVDKAAGDLPNTRPRGKKERVA